MSSNLNTVKFSILLLLVKPNLYHNYLHISHRKIQNCSCIFSNILYFQASRRLTFMYFFTFPLYFPLQSLKKGKIILSTDKNHYALLSVISDIIKSPPRRAKYTLRTNLRFVLWVFRLLILLNAFFYLRNTYLPNQILYYPNYDKYYQENGKIA